MRFPAEWEPHDACWLAWPSHPEEWPGVLEAARASFLELCAAIGESERLEILVLDPADDDRIAAALPGARVRFHRIPYGDIWTRDTAPVFVDEGGRLRAVCFEWSGWGGKYRFPDDVEVGARIAAALGAPATRVELYLEGGGVETDGAGTLLTTRQCVFSESRNRCDEAHADRLLRDALAIGQVIWLDRGLVNDHTDGHVDTLARFVRPGTVLCMHPVDGDPNRDALREIAAALRAARDAGGNRLEVIEIASPGRIDGDDGVPMPASYMNFYIANRSVIVPVYGAAGDAPAVDAIGRLFPERQVVAIDARVILSGGGTFHCITKQQPRVEP